MKLTPAQLKALRIAEKRDWPAGEPRVSWFHKATYARLVSLGLIEERFPGVVYLTHAGLSALTQEGER